MSVISVTESLNLINFLNQNSQSLNTFTELYRFYHIDLLAMISIPFFMLLSALMYYSLHKQRTELTSAYGIANIDPFTHLGNRDGINDVLLRELSRARRYKTETSVLMIDIDHFKIINESYGGRVGDRVLLHMVKIISDCLRLSDTLGRFGGEEFIVVLPQTGRQEATVVAERIRQTIFMNPLIDDAEPIIATVSIGVASYCNEQEDGPVKLISHSDQALYCAKHNGRNKVHCWSMH